MKKAALSLCLLMLTIIIQAQIANPIHFKTELKTTDGDRAEILFSAAIDYGWHIYATDLGQDGPIEATFTATKLDGAELVGKLQSLGKPIEQFDKMFGMTLRYFEGKGTFVQKIRFTKPNYVIEGFLEYGACNDEICLPPTQVEFKASGKSPVKRMTNAEKTGEKQINTEKDAEKEHSNIEKATEEEHSNIEKAAKEKPTNIEPVADGVTEENSTDSLTATNEQALSSTNLWAPITTELKAFKEDTNDISWWMIFLQGLLGGFLAILTPCVWPIIPMTVSFFLKRNKERSRAIREAITYGVSIVIIYVLLGLFVTLLFEASTLNAISTNALFNIFIALLLVMFAASFFGAFELRLPSNWSNVIDRKSENTTGLISIFLMAFTLTLVSFSCTGPIIGFLLVAVSTQGSIIAPTIGMLGFAIALAIPFTLFALFPSLLKSAPKSGGWMNTIKVVLGFIELAFALKFLSVADLAYGWHLLDREVFVSLWIVLFALLGIYLLGWLKFPHDDEAKRTNVPQFFLGMLSLAFAVYMLPGLWGAPLKAISAFAPPMNTQDFRTAEGHLFSKTVYAGTAEAKYKDYDQGMAAALAEGKPVMLDFTGFGCVNCRKMEAAVWTDPRVQDILNNRYVLISLYVDDKTPLPAPIEVKETNGQLRTLRTVGDKWSYFERVKVGANTQPCYVLLDPRTGKPLNALRSYDEDIEAYIKFLNTGLENYK